MVKSYAKLAWNFCRRRLNYWRRVSYLKRRIPIRRIRVQNKASQFSKLVDVFCGIAAGRVEFEAALEEVLEGRSLDASLSNSLTLPFIPSSTLSTADKNGSRGYDMWPCHLTWARDPGRARPRKIKWILLSQFKHLVSLKKFVNVSI